MPQPRISLTIRVLTVLQRHPYPLKPCQVARHLNCQSNVVRVILGRLCDRGDATTAEGLYSIRRDDDGLHIWDIFGVR